METKKSLKLPPTLRDLIPALVTFVFFGALFSLSSSSYLTVSNVINVLQQATTNLTIGVGIFFIIMSGNFDLSGSSILALTAILGCQLNVAGVPGILCWIISIAIGMAAGAVNGFAVAIMGLPAFIATLATQYMARGLAMVACQGLTIYGMDKAYLFLGNGKVGPFHMCILFVVVLYVLAHIVLKYTAYGHKIMAVGGNREAAKLAGINSVKIQILSYVLGGAMYALGGIVNVGRVQAVMSSTGNGIEMYAIAGIIIGGGSMAGGRGTMIGAFLGIFVVSMLSNGINMMGVNVYWTQFITGLIIFIAISLDVIRNVLLRLKKD